MTRGVDRVTKTPLRVGLAGVGAVGTTVARKLLEGIDGLTLAAISVRDEAKARAALPGYDGPVLSVDEIGPECDVVVECLPPAMFAAVARSVLGAGGIFMPLSVGQLLTHWDLVETGTAGGARVIAPTGALLGLDAVRAAAEGNIESVTMTTRKPPRGLKGAPYLEAHGIDVEAFTEPTCVYRGSVREAAKGFPANLNVAAALSLAGIGPDRTMLEVFADPTVSRNIHSIAVEADSARFSMTIENLPSAENPRTGRITALSTIAALRSLTAPVKIGT